MAGVNIMQETAQDKDDLYLSQLIKDELVIVKPSINEQTGEIGFAIIGVADGYKIDGALIIDVPVHKITALSFNGQDQLTEIAFDKESDANALKEIASGAFLDCPNLTSVSIPSSVERLGHGIFAGCNSLGDEGIYYGGSVEDWNKLVENSTKYNEQGEAINRWDEGAAYPNLHPITNANVSYESMLAEINAVSERILAEQQNNYYTSNEPAVKEEVRTLNYGFEEAAQNTKEAIDLQAEKIAQIREAVESIEKTVEAEKTAAKEIELDF